MRGTVTDAASHTPLPGVTVLAKGSTVGTTTDANGQFSLPVAPGSALVFSYVGYAAKEVSALPARSPSTLPLIYRNFPKWW